MQPCPHSYNQHKTERGVVLAHMQVSLFLIIITPLVAVRILIAAVAATITTTATIAIRSGWTLRFSIARPWSKMVSMALPIALMQQG